MKYNRGFSAIYRAMILLSLSLTMMVACSPEESVENPFPHKLPVSIALPAEESGVTLRLVFRATDGTVRRITSEYANGELQELMFDERGVPQESILYHSVEATGGDKAVKEHTRLKTDGTVESSVVYREDGSQARSGKRQPNGEYLLEHFAADGMTLTIVQTFAATNKLIDEKSLRADGSLESHLTANSRLIEKTYFNLDGKRRLRSVTARSGDETTYHYDDTGDLVMLKVDYTLLETKASYYDERGRVTQDREFWTDRLFVTIYDADQKPVYRQRWLRAGGDNVDPQYRFDGIMFFNSTGKIERTIDFQADGVVPSTETILEDPADYYGSIRIERRYGKDGKLKSVVRRNGFNGSIIEKLVKADPVKPVLKPEWLEMPEPHSWPPRPIPPIAHSDLDE